MTNEPRKRRARRPAAPEKELAVEDPRGDAPVKRRCTATNRHGEACSLSAIKGGTVCHKHGGSAPQVKNAARRRLNAMAEPAMDRLEKIIQDDNVPPRDHIRATLGVLDRTGYGPSSRVEVDTPWEAVVMGVVSEEGQKPAEWRQRRYDQYDEEEDHEYDPEG